MMQPLILIVEDNEANQLLESAVLELEGFAVVLAGSAPEALDVLRSMTPDLILMDFQLPGLDGLSLTRQLKDDPATAAIPVIALTAHAMRGDRDQALGAGCAGYIAKPIEVRTFGHQIRAFLTDPAGDQQLGVG